MKNNFILMFILKNKKGDDKKSKTFSDLKLNKILTQKFGNHKSLFTHNFITIAKLHKIM